MPCTFFLKYPSFTTILFVVLSCLPCWAAEPSEADLTWKDEANTRIERHRKADLQITVLNTAGQPVPDARIHVRQVRHAFLFGSNIFKWTGVPDQQQQTEYRRRFAEVFNFATLPFYWPSYERQQGRPRHDATAEVVAWCIENGLQCKGHPLAWNYSDPSWLPDDSRQIYDLQLARIDDCISRFKGRIDTWDVVNEATHFDRDEFLRRAPKMTTMWKKQGQLEFTRACFERARRTHPQATLLINDYRVDSAYERVIKQLVDGGGNRMYDVIGIQSHQHGGTWDNAKIWDVCERFAKFGVPLHFTETTILSGELGDQRAPWPSTPDGEAYQAREVERFYTMLYSHPAVEAITWWDFSDYHAWKRAPAGFLREDMTPKPAYDVLRSLIREQWWTDLKLTSDADGAAACRATPGWHDVRVELPDGSAVSTDAQVQRGQTNRLTVRL